MMRMSDLYSGFRFPDEVTNHGSRLYHRSSLSLHEGQVIPDLCCIVVDCGNSCVLQPAIQTGVHQHAHSMRIIYHAEIPPFRHEYRAPA